MRSASLTNINVASRSASTTIESGGIGLQLDRETRSARRCAPATPRRRVASMRATRRLRLRRRARAAGPSETGRSARPVRRELERDELPDAAALASLGCGNPIAVADLREGEVVLDLGSGGGIDVLLSARRVGPTGQGVRARHDGRDARARPAQRRRGGRRERRVPEGRDRGDPAARRVGRRRDLELRDQPLDRQARRDRARSFRVLRPGGRVGVSDVVAEDRLAPGGRAVRGSYVGCVAGALSLGEYEALLRRRRLRRDQRDVHPPGRRRHARRDRQGASVPRERPVRIGINGFGRMGRLALRAGWGRPDLRVRARERAGGRRRDLRAPARVRLRPRALARTRSQPSTARSRSTARRSRSAGAPSPATLPGVSSASTSCSSARAGSARRRRSRRTSRAACRRSSSPRPSRAAAR